SFGTSLGARCECVGRARAGPDRRDRPRQKVGRGTGEKLPLRYPAEALLAPDCQRSYRTQARPFITSTGVAGSRRAIRTGLAATTASWNPLPRVPSWSG